MDRISTIPVAARTAREVGYPSYSNAFEEIVSRLEALESEKPIDVVAAVRKKDGRYWVCRRNANGAHGGLAGLWEYPGGRVEPDEQLRPALVRELREEFPGVSPTIGAVLDSIEATYKDTTYRVTFFEVEMEDPTETPCHEEVGWFSPDEVCRMEHLPSGTIFNARYLAGVTRERTDGPCTCIDEGGEVREDPNCVGCRIATREGLADEIRQFLDVGELLPVEGPDNEIVVWRLLNEALEALTSGP